MRHHTKGNEKPVVNLFEHQAKNLSQQSLMRVKNAIDVRANFQNHSKI